MKITKGKALWIAFTAAWAMTGGEIRGAPVPAAESASRPSLVFSTYLGGSEQDRGEGIAVDEQGNAYVTGYTNSVDFPGALSGPGVPAHPPYRPYGAAPYASDSFLARLDPAGLFLSTAFLGAERPDVAQAITLGPSSVDITGLSLGSNGSSVFFARLGRPDLHSSYSFAYVTPEEYWNMGYGIAEDAQGNVYLTGRISDGLYWDYPKVGALAFVAKWNPATGWTYFQIFDGSEWYESGWAIATDAAGNVYVAGSTASADFPLGHPSLSTFHGGMDAFVMKLDAAGRFIYSTFLGGSDVDYGEGIAVTPGGEVYVTGRTQSTDFPLTRDALETTPESGTNLYVAKLDRSGALVYSSYLGGSTWEPSIAVDRSGRVFLAGTQISAASPLADPDRPDCHDSFVASLDLQDSRGLRSFCLAGAWIRALAADSRGNAYVTGEPRSAAFPVVNAVQPVPGSTEDAFVAKIAFNRPPDCSAAFASPATLWPPDGRLVPIAIRNVTDPDGDAAVITVTGVSQDEPLGKPGTPDAIGIGTSSASVRADRDGKGDGRVYRITFEASDGNGGVCTGAASVCVPHDQGAGKACGDGGGLFNSGG